MTTPEATEPRHIRPAAVAGRFYPGDPGELRKFITDLLAEVPPAQQQLLQ